MKPSFALHFTDDRVGLLHRTTRGWQDVGSVGMDDPDLPAALGYLRGSALGLEPRGLATKLVIPNAVVLYTRIDAPGPDASRRRAQIRAALEGMTAYDVADLVFDWRGTGKTVQVAVVARETLQEAEEFAARHRLNPLSFVAMPEDGQFSGEPWFGPSALAPTLLGPGEKVERDQDPVRIVSREPLHADVAKPTEGDKLPPTGDRPAEAAAMAPLPDPAPRPDDVVPAEPVPVDAVAMPPTPVRAEALPLPASPERVAPDETPPPIVLADTPVPPPIIAAPIVDTVGVVAATVAPPPPPPAPAQVSRPTIEEPAPLATAAETATQVAKPSAPAAVERLKARMAEQAADAPAFATRRATDGEIPQVGAARPAAGTAGAPSAGRAAKPAGRTETAVPPPKPTIVRPIVTAKPAGAKAAAARTASAAVTATGIPLPKDRKGLHVVPADPGGLTETAQNDAVTRKARTEAEAMTVFGERKAAQRGKPRYLGLILTGILLLFLAVFAALSPWLFPPDTPDAAAPAVSGAAPDSVLAPSALETAAAESAVAPDAAPAIADEMAADLQDPADFVVPSEADVAETALVDEPTPDLAAPSVAVPSANPVAAEAPSATEPASGEPAISIASSNAVAVPPAPLPVVEGPPPPERATVAPPATIAGTGRNPTDEPQDEIFLAMVDPAIATFDASALAPALTETDAPPAAQLAPPPFGTVYRFDAAGLIIPTPEGIVTPEGVLLVAGKPALVPPARPLATLPLAEAAAAETTADATGPGSPSIAGALSALAPLDPTVPAQDDAVQSDPALAGARPRARPAELAPPAREAEDDAALPSIDANRLTSLRPRARPAGALAADETRQAEATAAVQAAAASLAATAADGAVQSPLAVAVSRKPAPRPGDFSQAVGAATAALAAPERPALREEPAPEPQPVARAEPAPEPEPERSAEPVDEIDEPEVASAAPSIPQRSTVAKQATFRRAINLSKINLIGVYGTASNRSALVRQPNGRFVKVEVGDRVDGGRVAAISDKELRYVKNGKTLTLAMPRS